MTFIVDVKLEGALREVCVKIWLKVRYMDDGTTPMPPVKPGWRWVVVEGSLKFCVLYPMESRGPGGL